MKNKHKVFPNGTRLEALVIHNNKILVIKRTHSGNNYFVLPGGGWEQPESFESSVAREVMEEASIEVEVNRMVFDLSITNESRKIVYLCHYLKGKPILGDFNEKETMKNDSSDTYIPMWLPLRKLASTKLYTLEFRDWFLDNYKNRELPNKPEIREISPSQFRQG